jgi:uncharacterized protein YndB with AHSA1/START domain
MWTNEHSVETAADPSSVYSLMSDVASWPEWNAGVERIDLDGPFAAGTAGRMAMPGLDTLDFRLVWVEPDRGFEDETPMPGAGVTVHVRHELAPLAGGGTRITYRCSISGPASDTIGPEIGPAVTADFPQVMSALAARAEAAAGAG